MSWTKVSWLTLLPWRWSRKVLRNVATYLPGNNSLNYSYTEHFYCTLEAKSILLRHRGALKRWDWIFNCQFECYLRRGYLCVWFIATRHQITIDIRRKTAGFVVIPTAMYVKGMKGRQKDEGFREKSINLNISFAQTSRPPQILHCHCYYYHYYYSIHFLSLTYYLNTLCYICWTSPQKCKVSPCFQLTCKQQSTRPIMRRKIYELCILVLVMNYLLPIVP